MKPKPTYIFLGVLGTSSFIFIFSAVKMGAFDFWMHLAAGRYMIQTQSIPLTDPFTYTAGPSPWINDWWLSQVLFYLLYTNLGPWALIFLKAFLITILWALILKLALDSGLELFITIPLILLGALAGQESWGTKPHFFTFFFFALTYYVLSKSREPDSPLPWALVPLFAVWANLHPGYPAGLLLIFLFILEQGQKIFSFSRQEKNFRRKTALLFLFGGGAVVACFLTPFGLKGFWQPFLHAKDMGLLKFLGEWVSPQFLYAAFYPFEFLLLLLLAMLALSPYRLSWFELLSLILFGHMALQSFRHIPFFAVAVMLPLGKAIMEFVRENFRRKTAVQIILFLSVLLFLFSSPAWKDSKNAGFVRELQENPQYLPIRTVKILHDSQIPGPLFCTYSWNGYEVWALQDKYQVFIDGRSLLYPQQVIRDYLQIQESSYLWEPTLKKYQINVILVDKGLPLARLLAGDRHWQKVYEDSLAVLYRRQVTPER